MVRTQARIKLQFNGRQKTEGEGKAVSPSNCKFDPADIPSGANLRTFQCVASKHDCQDLQHTEQLNRNFLRLWDGPKITSILSVVWVCLKCLCLDSLNGPL